METANTQMMNGKQVVYVPAKSVLNMESGFRHKLLCDGPTFTAGTACAFSCSYCYVPEMMKKSPHLSGIDKHEDVVIRREGAIEALERQLTSRGKPKYNDPNDRRVLYMSPLVDVAANAELAAETIVACLLILELTHWDIRILSKSTLLGRIANELERNGYKSRVIFGLSTGTADPRLAASFESGTSSVTARLEMLRDLQDAHFRTFGMICPSLPQRDYADFAEEMHFQIRGDRCEAVWAECMNARGDSFDRTHAALLGAGYGFEAAALKEVATDDTAWENYARATFLAHAPLYRAGQLRFLQYVNKASRAWWEARSADGAVLL